VLINNHGAGVKIVSWVREETYTAALAHFRG
jgi:hypothetical protein